MKISSPNSSQFYRVSMSGCLSPSFCLQEPMNRQLHYRIHPWYLSLNKPFLRICLQTQTVGTRKRHDLIVSSRISSNGTLFGRFWFCSFPRANIAERTGTVKPEWACSAAQAGQKIHRLFYLGHKSLRNSCCIHYSTKRNDNYEKCRTLKLLS